MRLITLDEMRGDNARGKRNGQISRALSVLGKHPQALFFLTSYENTGRQFGNRERRRDKCEKIGASTYHYQLWASWAPRDIADYSSQEVTPR